MPKVVQFTTHNNLQHTNKEQNSNSTDFNLTQSMPTLVSADMTVLLKTQVRWRAYLQTPMLNFLSENLTHQRLRVNSS